MTDDSGRPGGLSEREVLARLTIAEKRRIARLSLMEFPHLDHGMLDGWLRGHSATPVGREATLEEKIDALLDRCETLVRSGEEPEALDHFIYGYLYPANLRAAGIDPEEVADREPLGMWNDAHGTG